jgi:hypothetical protein
MDRRRRAWAILCIGEPAAEIEDTFADEVPIAFGRQVLRLAFAELGRPRDECRAESRPLGKREIAIAGRRAQGIVPAPERNHAIRAVIEEAIRAREAGESKVIPFNLCGHGHFDMQAYTTSWRAAFRRSSSRKRRWPTV